MMRFFELDYTSYLRTASAKVKLSKVRMPIMLPKFICHPDFADLKPIDVFHKELATVSLPEHPEELKNKHILYRRRITLTDISSATLKITADDYYKLYINGSLVTMGPAASYTQNYNYNEIDVTSFLKEGENVIAVHTYYQGLINRVWVSGDLRHMLWCELSVNQECVLVSDESWKCAYHTAYTPVGIIGYDTAYTECFDSRSKEIFFSALGYDDSHWQYASIYKQADYSLVKQDTLQIDVYKTKPKTIKITNYGYYVDLGQEMVGYLSVTASGREGDEIILRYSEELDEAGAVRYNMRCNCKYEEKWILSGNTDQLDNYDYKAFRYAEIHIPEGVTVMDISMTVRHYPFTAHHIYKTDNDELNRILELCASTIKYITQENYVDCPTREKGQYLGDVSIAGRAHAILTENPEMMKKAVMDFCHTSFVCPGVMAVSCSSLMQEIADYSLQLPSAALWAYRFDNDVEFLRKAEPYLTKMYEYFLSFTDESGLIHDLTEKNNIVDWPANLRDNYEYPDSKKIGNGKHNVVNAFWYSAVVSLDEIYKALGIKNDSIAEKIKASYYDAFYKEELGLFADNTESSHAAIHSNILPLLFGICDGDNILIENIINLLEKKRLTSMGTYMSYFALAALVKHGRYALAKELTCDKDAWLNMLSEGATTTFEAWGKEKKWNTSLCHPWSVAPLIIFNNKYPIY